jgi:hypothetical protein
MDRTAALELTLLAGAHALLAAHARELPQRDDQCGAFCGALALEAAGVERIDQDDVARAAGTLVSRVPDRAALPAGEHGRRDYRLAPPLIDDSSASGTNCAGVVRARRSRSRAPGRRRRSTGCSSCSPSWSDRCR